MTGTGGVGVNKAGTQKSKSGVSSITGVGGMNNQSKKGSSNSGVSGVLPPLGRVNSGDGTVGTGVGGGLSKGKLSLS